MSTPPLRFVKDDEPIPNSEVLQPGSLIKLKDVDHLWLNLGCSDNLRKEFINVDCRQFNQAEYDLFHCQNWDLNQLWLWKDSTVDYILAADIIEHLSDHIRTMNEMWRVLKPGGIVDIFVPTTEGRGAFQDPNHKSFWNRNSFFYYTNGDPHRERFGDSYGVKARFEVVDENTEELMDRVVKLHIILRAVKPDANSGS
jgi:SAM-dependent methyltransferase